MKKIRKRIAVFLAQPESMYQNEIMRGITEEAFSLDIDVCVFAMFMKNKSEDDRYTYGESNIYKLANMESFDGAIVAPDVIMMRSAIDYIENVLLGDYKKPVVYLDDKSHRFDYVAASDDKGFEQLVAHLALKHKCKSIAFMTGFEGHIQSINRIEAFKKAMAKYKLPVDDSMIYYGDFWYDMGEGVVEKLMEREKLPDAIMCASDAMALSVYRAFKKRGVRVPRDIIVTGYDNNSDGIDQEYFVTSIPRYNHVTAVNAVRLLNKKMSGAEYIPFEPTTMNLFIGKTCGCHPTRPPARNGYRIYHCAYDINEGFYSGYNFMLENTIGAYDLTDCFWKINWYSSYLGETDNFYICLCDGWDAPGTDSEGYLRDGYSPKMTLAYEKYCEGSSVKLDSYFDVRQMLPDLDVERDKPAVYYFLPMHFVDRCFGYYAVKQTSPEILFCPVFTPWARNVNNSLESIRRQIQVRYMYKKIDESALIDLATSLYSRNGFNIYAPEMLRKAKNELNSFIFILGDLNCLKYINDTYGHTEGDFAIKAAAEAFKMLCPDPSDNNRVFRIGGDEFVQILVGHYNEDDIKVHIEKIRTYLDKFNKTSGRLYPVQISLGFYCRDLCNNDEDTIDTISSYADKEMFRDKQKIKEETGFDYSRNYI